MTLPSKPSRVCAPAAVATLLSRCRKLQNRLGVLNDLAVQQRRLIDLTKGRGGDLASAPSEALAVGVLIGVLAGKQNRLRRDLPRELRRVAAAKTQRAVARLLPQNERS